MVFWLGIMAAAFCAWYAVKMGFYETWAMLFNVLISIYLALCLTPVIMDAVPAAADTPFGNALCLAAVAVAAFLILHGITYTFLTGQFRVEFPKILDGLAGAILGFLGGFLIWSFLVLVVSVTPISRNSIARSVGLGPPIRQTTVPYLARWCDLVNAAAASPDTRQPAQKTIARLLDEATKKRSPNTPTTIDPNAPTKPPDTREKPRPRLRRPELDDL